jgi:hypothetical protein
MSSLTVLFRAIALKTLQAGQKLPRWQPGSRRAVFMGFSNLQSSEVPLVLNLTTGSITPQSHVVFDDHFSKVSSAERENDPPDNWAELCLDNTTYIPTDAIKTTSSSASDSSLGLDFTSLSSEDQEWATRATRTEEQEWATRATTSQDAIPRDTLVQPSVVSLTPVLPFNAPSATSTVTKGQGFTVSKRSRYAQVTAPVSTTKMASVQPVPSLIAPKMAVPSEPPPLIPRVTEVPEVSGLRRSARTTKGVFQKTRYIDGAFLLSMHTLLDPDGQAAQLACMAELFTSCSDTGIVKITDPVSTRLKL